MTTTTAPPGPLSTSGVTSGPDGGVTVTVTGSYDQDPSAVRTQTAMGHAWPSVSRAESGDTAETVTATLPYRFAVRGAAFLAGPAAAVLRYPTVLSGSYTRR